MQRVKMRRGLVRTQSGGELTDLGFWISWAWVKAHAFERLRGRRRLRMSNVLLAKLAEGPWQGNR